mgnify:FL=1
MKRNILFPLIPVAQEIGNLVDEFVNKGLNDVMGGSIWQHTYPAVNIRETENSFFIDMAAPGLDKQDFKISAENGMLSVSVNKETSTESKGENFHRQEFNYQSFKRSFHMPEHADPEKINASYNNGVLSISIDKKVVVKNEKTIEVK